MAEDIIVKPNGRRATLMNGRRRGKTSGNHILVTGAGGYIGTVLVEELLEHGYGVVAFDQFFFGEEVLGHLALNPRLLIRKGDIRDITEGDLEGIYAVCDLAALSNDPTGELSPDLTLDINYRGRVRIAGAAKRAGVSRYVLSSSCSVYGQRGATDGEALMDETTPTAPLTTYARANLRAEEDILPLDGAHFCATALRNATVFGPSPRMRFDLVVNQMTLSAVRTGRITAVGGGGQWRPHIHVRDVARAFRTVIEAPAPAVTGTVFNVGGQNARIIDVAAMIRDALPDPIEIDVTSDEPDRRDYRVSPEKIARALGFEARLTIQEGVRQIYDALKAGRLESTQKTTTVGWYRQLIEAQRVVERAKIDPDFAALSRIGEITMIEAQRLVDAVALNGRML
jgi:nucleoside-diphosphate-sugar epimerase